MQGRYLAANPQPKYCISRPLSTVEKRVERRSTDESSKWVRLAAVNARHSVPLSYKSFMRVTNASFHSVRRTVGKNQVCKFDVTMLQPRCRQIE